MDMEDRKEVAWDLFAAAALQGMLACGINRLDATRLAAETADEMMKEWGKR